MRPIPSPKGLPVFGTMLAIMASGGASKLHLYVDRRHRELASYSVTEKEKVTFKNCMFRFGTKEKEKKGKIKTIKSVSGPIYREKIGPVLGVFVADGNYMRKIFAAEGKYPRHIIPESWLFYNKLYGCERGLLFMDGEEWLKYRKIMNNVMLKVNQNAFYSACDEAAKDLVEKWREGGQILQLETHLYEWSLKVIVAALLGYDNYMLNKTRLVPPIEQMAKTVHQIFVESAKLSLMPVQIAMKANLPVWKRFVRAANSAIEEGKNLVEKLLEMENENPDNKSLLLEMANHEVQLEYLKRIATDLILAAGDTTAYTTQWLLHLLSIDSDSQTKIYNQMINYPENDVNQCQLLKGALKEALRLYPVAPFLTRFMPEDLIVGEYQIKAEELVLMSLYTSGRNENYFPNPDSFMPQRWIRKNNDYEGVLNPNSFLPFAMGTRSCVGKKLAEMQILVTISKVLRNFTLKSDQKKRIDIKLHLIAVPAEPVNIILEPRQKLPTK